MEQHVKDQFSSLDMISNETKMRADALQRQMQSFEHIKFELLDKIQSKEPAHHHGQAEIQIASLKEAALMDRQRTETQNDEINRQYQGLVVQTHQIKQELMNKLKEHRDEYLGIFNQSEEERARTDKIKIDKQDQDNYNFNQMVQALEKKFEVEVTNRKKNEDDQKLYLETKFAHLLEQGKTDEKLALEREKRMMTQV